MGNDAVPAIEHAKVRLLAGPLTEDEDPELWSQVLIGRDHIAKWFDEIGIELVVHSDYRIALLRQASEAQREQRAAERGRAVLPPLLHSRALSFFESQVLSYLHDKLNSAASMGIFDLSLLRSEVHDAIVNLQPEAQRNKEATLTNRIHAAHNKFREYDLIEETQLGGQPAIQPKLILLVMVPRDELERFSELLRDLLATPEPSDACAVSMPTPTSGSFVTPHPDGDAYRE